MPSFISYLQFNYKKQRLLANKLFLSDISTIMPDKSLVIIALSKDGVSINTNEIEASSGSVMIEVNNLINVEIKVKMANVITNYFHHISLT